MKQVVALMLIMGLMFGFSACAPGGTDTPGKKAAAAELVASPKYPEGIGFDDLDARRANRLNNPVSRATADAIQAFSFKTAAPLLGAASVNSCYSPLSVYYALALSSTGANGQTKDELFTLLGALDAEKLSLEMSNLYRLLYSDNKISQLKIANSLWLDHDYQGQPVVYKEPFTQNAASRFYASLFRVDFAEKSAGDAMSQWIDDQTKGTLKPTFSPDPEQILSILNTIYFKDEWTDRFKADQTKPDTFHLADGKDVTCDFMNMTYSSHGFSKGEGFIRSALNLKSNAQMVFVLPDKGIDLRQLINSPEKLRSLFESGKGTNGKVIWKIPKFSYDSDFKLVDTLKQLGITSMFKSNADFTGITDHQAFVSRITHKTHIAIDENGVVASAFTKMDYAGAAVPVDQAEMILDRPFIYAIFSSPLPLVKEAGSPDFPTSTGVPLFIGICGNPVAP